MNLKRITLDRRKCNDPIAYIRKQKFQYIKDQCNFEVWSVFGAWRLQHSAFLQREVPCSHTVKPHHPLQPSQGKMRETRPFPPTLWILLGAVQPSAITEIGENSQIGAFTSMISLELGNFRPGLSSYVSVSNQMKSLCKDWWMKP